MQARHVSLQYIIRNLISKSKIKTHRLLYLEA
ncbi:hypothetical protein HD_1248 [[Haemophilus] ducreyi 35000HP]|uniref:Uncharacterized protein n=1 Tax=Haemophilus ducreyi (strain 35000HP / ATCC 700724) TaxID=233412 RepID=Q7VLY7_HAEDU|nr:hypothetical protein HD_1248 [[Haemophilus] ducreyi 35000HP]